MLASVVIRTYNEERYLDELLSGVSSQAKPFFDVEIVVVDSGSTDGTLNIAERYGCKIVHIRKEDFTFGRSLNYGCEAASGEFLVFISGHCVPVNENWLRLLIGPLADGKAAYSYGRQLGRDTTKFSEVEVFGKYFPETSQIPQDGFFCNNANAALLKAVWESHSFDETLTGLEDIELARRLTEAGHKVAYVADGSVHHIHDETWPQIRNRYEREALALRSIVPEVHVRLSDFVRYVFASVTHDLAAAIKRRVFFKVAIEIIVFRLMQYWGTYRGNHLHRRLSAELRERYFFPRKSGLVTLAKHPLKPHRSDRVHRRFRDLALWGGKEK